jgi:hypothetical protein
MRAIWQFIKKHEFWVWMVIWAGFVTAYEITKDALYASIAFPLSLVAGTRLAMHPMWKKDEEENSD